MSATPRPMRAGAAPAEGKLLRRWNTLRYYRPGQVVRRAATVVRSRLTRRRPVERFLSAGRMDYTISPPPGFQEISARKLEQRRTIGEFASRLAAIRDGRLTFLGRTLNLGREVDWQSARLADVPRLWRFQLEYHEWLLDLAAGDAAGSENETSAAIWGHIQRWIDAWSGATEGDACDAWHPFCISRRIPVWLALWAWRAPAESLRDDIARSLYAQAAFLSRRLETDLGGNHLLENARGLAIAGAAFSGREAARWRDQAGRILERECREQVLPHGEHFERSPMYHCLMIDALADVRDATRETVPALSELCGETVQRMEQFISQIRHPDGEIALLGDSCFSEAPHPLIASSPHHASSSSAAAAQIGSYWAFRDRGDFLLFDAGPVGPDHLPAHAHADLLTIEASVAGRRLLVDSGTYDYEDSPMRQYCRTTAAHNVLEVDGQNQCDVWSRFRMGRRGWPTPLVTGESEGFAWGTAAHNAYRHLGLPVVGRWVGCRPEFPWLIVDWALGSGAHSLVNRLHLHPDVAVRAVRPDCVELESGEQRLYVTGFGPGELRMDEGWYCPEFGSRIANPVLEWRYVGSLPAAFGWMVSAAFPEEVPGLFWDHESICVETNDGVGTAIRIAAVR